MTGVKRGVLYGVGLGPGDPELMTLKALRIIKSSAVIGYFRKRGRPGHARTIAQSFMRPDVRELPFDYPVTTEEGFANDSYVCEMRSFYSACCKTLAAELDQGRDVALLCEGDPFFYGSFLHMYDRLKPSYDVTVVPGITGMSGCWTAADQPMTYGDDVLTVLPGTLSEQQLQRRLADTDAAVIMKVGTNIEKIKSALRNSGRFDAAIYVERGTMQGQKVVPLSDLGDAPVPYFSIVLLPGGRGRRIV